MYSDGQGDEDGDGQGDGDGDGQGDGQGGGDGVVLEQHEGEDILAVLVSAITQLLWSQ